jgi:ABC-type spermidine/putrescine transport system permease subunit I
MLPALTSTLRHVFTTLLGAYVTKGVLTGDQATMLIDAAITVLGIVFVVIWSNLEKKFTKKK